LSEGTPAAPEATPGNPPLAGAGADAAGRKLTEGVLGDATVEERTIEDKQWVATKRRFDQQDTMIRAMIQIFTWLNGAVVLIVIVFWVGDFWRHDPIITENVIMSIIGATIVQAGLAFMSITKFLFPGDSSAKGKDKGEATGG
jgi:hypothetical protein